MRLDLINVRKRKKVGGGGREREKGDQINNFNNVNRSKHRASGRWGKKVKFRGIFSDKFAEKRPISRKNSGQILLESDRSCADFTNVFNETKWLFVGEGGGEGE